MSRLESLIRRLTAQRNALDWVVARVVGVPGDVLEVGLGNGRTYDHLRERMPRRRIRVIERDPRPHPACMPPLDDLVLGEADAAIARLHDESATFAVVHYDLGAGDAAFAAAEALALAGPLARLVGVGGALVSSQPMPTDTLGMQEAPSAETGGGGRVFVYLRP